MNIISLSDTHGHFQTAIPEGDLVIHAGDFSGRSSWDTVEKMAQWFGSLPHKYKIVIAGNHETVLEGNFEKGKEIFAKEGVIYLQDTGVQIEEFYVYGSPWQPFFYDWSFNLQRGAELREKWAMIPEKTDILITHGPPYGIMDMASRGVSIGCQDLLERIQEVKPKLHVFGHNHNEYGIRLGYEYDNSSGQVIQYVNASIRDEKYRICRSPIVVHL